MGTNKPSRPSFRVLPRPDIFPENRERLASSPGFVPSVAPCGVMLCVRYDCDDGAIELIFSVIATVGCCFTVGCCYHNRGS